MKTTIASILFGWSLLCCALSNAFSAEVQSPRELLPADQPTIPLLHTRWLVRDGVPPNVRGIAQTPDGWLWLASPSGLFRFDGVAFTPYRPPPGVNMQTNLQLLGTLPDGRLWVAPRFGGLYLLKGQQLAYFGKDEGLPSGLVNNVALGPDGRLWVATGKGLHMLDPGGRQWRNVAEEMAVRASAHDVLVDRAGTVWVQTNDGNFALRVGEKRFSLIAPQIQPGSKFLQDPNGTVWMPDLGLPGVRRLTPGVTPAPLDDLLTRLHAVDSLFIDRDSNFWFPRIGGIVRIATEGGRFRTEGFTARQGLSGRDGQLGLQDREGNVWVITESGLDQFRRGRMRDIPLRRYVGETRPIAAAPDGQLWIDYSWLKNIHAQPYDFGPQGSMDNLIWQMYRDPDGTVWYGTSGKLWKLDGLKRVNVPMPPEVERLVMQPIFSIARDAEGAMWVSLGPRGTWRLKDGAWKQHGGIGALAGYGVTTIIPGPGAQLWFGSVGNSMAILRDGQVRKIGPAQGLDIGAVMHILPEGEGEGAWLAGDEGLAWFDGRQARRILGEGGEQFQGGTVLLRGQDGAMWINAVRGLVHIAADELKQVLADPGHRLRFRRYDANDGLVGAPAPLLTGSSMAQTPEGHLVISTVGGVFHFDPASSLANRLAPTVQVTGIAAGPAAYALTDRLTLPAAVENLRIDYTALSLTLPQRVRFRYMLEGVDSEWQDPGPRRSAFYTRLDPGEYTFRVKAANDDGVWNEEGASLRFVVPPTMAQTMWFKVACALVLALMVYALHRLRLRMALRRQSRLFDTRVAERERIARDLHDTLLQSVQGLIMHFRRIALKTPSDAPTHSLMQEALAMATEVLEEGRDRVGGLRTPAAQADLAALLDCHGQALAGQHPVRFSLHEEGLARRLRAPVLDEVLAIGREAVRNAFLHAEAEHIEVTLRHGEREFEMVVTDDGVGIEPAMHAGRAGHWGICGMRERAAELGATFDLRSAPGEGSTWRLRLAARLAYADDGDTQAGPAATAERAGALQ